MNIPRLLLSLSAAATLCVAPVANAVGTFSALNVPSPSASWTTPDGLVTLTDSSGDFRSGGSSIENCFGGSGSNQGYDNADGASLQLSFSPNSGLRQIGSIWTRASARISGFVSDPGLSIQGSITATATYDAATGTVTISQGWAGGAVILYNFADPSASAGRTLVFTFDRDIGGAAGYQFCLNRVGYQISLNAPAIATGLPASSWVAAGGAVRLFASTAAVVAQPTLVNGKLAFGATLEAGAFPAVAYRWEFQPSNGAPWTEVSASSDWELSTATPAQAGTYRLTVSNSGGSASTTTDLAVLADSDGDSLPDIYETNTGIFVSPTDTGSSPTMADTDGDSLSDFAEVFIHRTNPNQADTDGDGLSDSSELLVHNTDPLNADTDGDGLSDGDEVLVYNTNPLILDTDGDGFSDGWEVNSLASNPTDPTSPNLDDGRRSIGIAFAANWGERPAYFLEPHMFAGAPNYVQKNWNRTDGLKSIGYEENSVVAPVPGTLVDNQGTVTGMWIDFNAAGLWSAANESQTTYGRLYSGYLDSTGNNGTINVWLDHIPYSRYDVVVYVGSAGAGRTGSVTLNGLTYHYTTNAVTVPGEVPAYVRTADSNAFFSPEKRFNPSANVVIFRGQTAASIQLVHQRGSNNAGIFAIQVVEDLDSSGDGMGNFFKTFHGLNPLASDANADADGDGLTNLFEHNFGTHPSQADSDGDSLSDAAEWNVHGTNPFMPDTDGDGLSDGEEVQIAGTNPLLADTDNDGYLDGYEALVIASNPLDANSPGGPNPEAIGIAFDNVSGGRFGYALSPATFAGAPAVRQKNWNRTEPLISSAISFTQANIVQPQAGALVDSSGAATAVTASISAGGAWAAPNERDTPYGRLFKALVYNTAAVPNVTVALGNIPYESYDVYVYFGSDYNGRTGLLSSGSTAFSFTSAADATAANGLDTYVETTSAAGNPVANYAVFRGQSSPSFSFTLSRGSDNVGIFGIQIVKQGGPPATYAQWAALHVDGQAADLDFDGDGVPNGVQYFMGITAPRATPRPQVVNGAITWPRDPSANASYVVQTSTELAAEGQPGGWSAVTSGVVDSGNSITFTLPMDGPKLFVRLKVIIP
jgi:hypothetical protein